MTPSVPRPSAEVVEATASLAVAIDEGRALARRLVLAYAAGPLSAEERALARAAAAMIAADSRICFLRILQMQEELTENLWPHAALRVGQAIACSLVALGEEEPESLAVLSVEDLDGLAERNGAAEWLEFMLTTVREGEGS